MKTNAEKINLEEVEKQIRTFEKEYDYNLRELEVSDLLKKFIKDKQYINSEATTASIYIPDFQRKHVWENPKQSKYIESLFLGVPMPPLFVVLKDEFANMELIDGVQRLSTLYNFVNDKLVLQDLELLDTLNGLKFSDLHHTRQRKFNALGIRYYVILEGADEGVYAEIFSRINTGSLNLTPAEVRKGAFAKNKFYLFILKTIESPLFNTLFTSKKEEDKLRGSKEELLSRFFAYSEDYLSFEHSVRHFIDLYISRKGKNGFNETEKLEEFNRTFEFIKKHLPNGLKKSATSNTIPKVRFEALTVGTNLALKEKPNLVPNYSDWIDSKEFKRWTTSDAANNKNKVVGRIEFVRDSLLGKIS
ncbi:MAG: DUF262 domain-containing protein [Flavobacterium sp.]|nr:DUF262 domain-containing protein [Flavobacterium sp.]